MKNLLAAAAMAALLPMASAHAAELLTNGNFDAGNTGFTSEYSYEMLNGLQTNLWPEGTYNVNNDPYQDHYLFGSFGDHTSSPDNGLMMVINGSVTLDKVVWAEGSNAHPLGGAGSYTFSFWLADVYPSSPANLNLWINGTKLTGDQGGLFQAVGGSWDNVGVWQHFTYTGTVGAEGLKTIALTNNNLEPSGNDFALDDMSLIGSPTPEPASWALMLVGFGGLGAMLRANRRRSLAAA